MGLSCRQFRLHVVRPTLETLGLWTLAAEKLMVATAAVESGGFRFIDQVTRPGDDTLGPGLGLYQLEAATARDTYLRFLSYRPPLLAKVDAFLAPKPSAIHQLATNLAYATAMARIVYYRDKEPLPSADDLEGLGRYYKRVYNTEKGKGTVEGFLNCYKRHVAPSW